MCKDRIFTALSIIVASFVASAQAAESQWVYPGSDGKLVYKSTDTGDRIMDFSYAGYMGGGVALPDVPVKKTIKPSGGEDDTAMIQAAIDEVAKLPLMNGFRGAVLLEPGTYPIAGTVVISTGGVVLRGSGSGADGKSPISTLKLIGRPHGAIAIRGAGQGRNRGSPQPPTDPTADTPQTQQLQQQGGNLFQTSNADAYIPSGAMSFSVTDASGFAVGDTISIRRPVTDAWVKFMHMDDMTRDGRPQTWIRAGNTTTAERTIAKINGKTITLDVPLADSYDAKYLNPPGTIIAKLRPPQRVTQAGVEYLHIECPPQEISHTQPHFTAMRINGQDCWARDIQIDETMNSVGIGGKRITLQRVAVNRKARHQGASKPAEFAPNGEQVLLDRCSVSGDNIFYVATGAGVSGPVVILNCAFSGNGRAESHQRWSTGILYDNCRVPDGGIELRNRGSMGSGHGWSMGWGVVWNCVAKDFIIQNPPGSANWMIGCMGTNRPSPRPFGSGPMLAGGIEDAPGAAVAPQSLYLAQLAARLGPQALKNIGYSSATEMRSGDKVPEARPEAKIDSDKSLGEDLAMFCPVLASNAREGKREFNAWQALDGDDKTYWATDDTTNRPPSIELDTEGALDINAAAIGEAIGMTGRVKEFKIEGFVDSAWQLLAQGTTIGDEKLVRFPKVTVWKVKLTILRSDGYPAIRKFGLYLAKDS